MPTGKRLSDQQIIHMRELHRGGMSEAEIASMYRLNPHTVNHHLKGMPDPPANPPTGVRELASILHIKPARLRAHLRLKHGEEHEFGSRWNVTGSMREECKNWWEGERQKEQKRPQVKGGSTPKHSQREWEKTSQEEIEFALSGGYPEDRMDEEDEEDVDGTTHM